MADLYAQAGVNVSAGDEFSKRAATISAATNGNARFFRLKDFSKGNFRGPRSLTPHLPPKCSITLAVDGAGTKTTFYAHMSLHARSAHDIVAMSCGDITRYGGLPQIFFNDLKPKTLGEIDDDRFMLFQGAIEELAAVCNKLDIIAYTGETAEMNVCIGSDNPDSFAPFIWDGGALGVYHEDKIIYGDRVQAGDAVIALKENGFRSNGISLVRKTFSKHYGADFYNQPEAWPDMDDVCAPSVLYDKMLATANGWYNEELERLYDVRLIAHMTGGGIGKFTEQLALNGLSARLDDLFDLPPIMRKCAQWSGIDSRHLYEVWNGGQGVILVVPPEDVDHFIEFARSFGISAQVCGEITPSLASVGTTVEVTSKYDGEQLLFRAT